MTVIIELVFFRLHVFSLGLQHCCLGHIDICLFGNLTMRVDILASCANRLHFCNFSKKDQDMLLVVFIPKVKLFGGDFLFWSLCCTYLYDTFFSHTQFCSHIQLWKAFIVINIWKCSVQIWATVCDVWKHLFGSCMRFLLLSAGSCSCTAWWSAVDFWRWICQSYTVSVLSLQRSMGAESKRLCVAESHVSFSLLFFVVVLATCMWGR